MRVQNTLNIRSGLMDSPMNDEARLVDAQPRRVINNVALQIDLDKAGRRYLIVQQAKRVEQHMLLFARNAAGDVIVNAIRQPEMGYQPVAFRQFDSRPPLVFGHAVLDLRASRSGTAHRKYGCRRHILAPYVLLNSNLALQRQLQGERRGRLDIAIEWTCREQGCRRAQRSEEHTSELQSLMRLSYAVFCLK